MTQLTIQLPETAFSALQKDPEEFVQEMRLAAAVKWYELGQYPRKGQRRLPVYHGPSSSMP